jgi:hypothetical protein
MRQKNPYKTTANTPSQLFATNTVLKATRGNYRWRMSRSALYKGRPSSELKPTRKQSPVTVLFREAVCTLRRSLCFEEAPLETNDKKKGTPSASEQVRLKLAQAGRGQKKRPGSRSHQKSSLALARRHPGHRRELSRACKKANHTASGLSTLM